MPNEKFNAILKAKLPKEISKVNLPNKRDRQRAVKIAA